MEDPVEVGVELLSNLEREMTLAEAVDRIETVTTNPATTRAILEEAEERGIVDRSGGTVRSQTSAYVRFESDVVTKDGEFACRRCGAELSTGHFIRLDAGEVGPFGSTCVRTVTGRE